MQNNTALSIVYIHTAFLLSIKAYVDIITICLSYCGDNIQIET